MTAIGRRLPAGAGRRLVDGFGRAHGSLRVSVTDRCNLRCRYCMPAEGMPWLGREELLSAGEIERFVALFARLGVRRVRITGGEPLIRPDLADIVERVRQQPGIDEVALTTNGVLLEEQVDDLVAAGLDRVNVSLDSLDPDRFERIARRRELERVLAGLDACERHPHLAPIKVNAVLLRGLSEADVLPLAELARRRPYVVRFIEVMPIDAPRRWRPDQVLSGAEVRETIMRTHRLLPLGRESAERTSTRWEFADGAGMLEFVCSVTQPFCAQCDRLRLTADGQLRTCLFAEAETDLRRPLRSGADEAHLENLLRDAVGHKPSGHHMSDPEWDYAGRPMSRIGG